MILIAIALLVVDILLWIAYKREKEKSDNRQHTINELLRYKAEKEKPKAMTAPIVKKEPAPMVFHYGKKEEPKIPRGYRRHDGNPITDKDFKSGTKLYCIDRSGRKITFTVSLHYSGEGSIFHHNGLLSHCDIIAYKVVKPKKKTMKRKK